MPPSARRKATRGAVEFLIETYRSATDEIVLVPVAPLSNIAAALALDPKFVERVPEVVIMGGGHEIGNVTPAAEFNIWADPEAAAMVFAAGFRKVTLVPLDATHRALISKAHCARLAALGTPAGDAAAAFIGHRIGRHDELQKMATPGTAPVHDALCVGVLIDPTLIATRRLHVAVETQRRADSRADRHRHPFPRRRERANCDVAFDADAVRFAALLVETFAKPARALHTTPSSQGLALGSTSLPASAWPRPLKLVDGKAKPCHDE